MTDDYMRALFAAHAALGKGETETAAYLLEELRKKTAAAAGIKNISPGGDERENAAGSQESPGADAAGEARRRRNAPGTGLRGKPALRGHWKKFSGRMPRRRRHRERSSGKTRPPPKSSAARGRRRRRPDMRPPPRARLDGRGKRPMRREGFPPRRSQTGSAGTRAATALPSSHEPGPRGAENARTKRQPVSLPHGPNDRETGNRAAIKHEGERKA
jgi:hypothetical protein